MEAVIKESVSNPRHSRFKDADWYNSDLNIIQIGCGGIGSWLGIFLSRIGDHNIFLFDEDTIDETNFGGQLFMTSQLKVSKTAALNRNIYDFSNNYRVAQCGKFDETSMVCPIMFSALDNMKYRKMAFERWCELEDKEIFIDGRMSFQTGIVYAVTPKDIDRYKATLFDDSEVPDEACSMRATSHNGAIVAANMTNVFTNFLANKKLGDDIYTVAFKQSHELPLLFNTVEL